MMDGRGQRTEDLTWGYKMPQGQLLILEIDRYPEGVYSKMASRDSP